MLHFSVWNNRIYSVLYLSQYHWHKKQTFNCMPSLLKAECSEKIVFFVDVLLWPWYQQQAGRYITNFLHSWCTRRFSIDVWVIQDGHLIPHFTIFIFFRLTSLITWKHSMCCSRGFRLMRTRSSPYTFRNKN